MKSKIKNLRSILVLVIMTLVGLGASVLLASQHSNEAQKYWVFFTDKGQSLSKRADLISEIKDKLSMRALKRRAKVRRQNEIIDEFDFQVSEDYLSKLRSLGHEPVTVSNWLNATSLFLAAHDITEIKKLAFVKGLKRVARASHPLPRLDEPKSLSKLQKSGSYRFDYGSSFGQNELINIPSVHELGITGKGVVIGMLDTGFKTRNHAAFQHLDLLGEYDFLNNDTITENEIGQDHPLQDQHGTQTLSVIGGLSPGELVGAAFDATFLLAKTEDLLNEVRQEEDHWVAGLEWLESQGVDVVSSSVGYLDFYNPSEMDGNTAVTTIAADLAVQRGVVIVNSAGNEGNSTWQTVISPADGDSVIAVGAVNSTGSLASFSSKGPSADGRIKPDVVALGLGVFVASPSPNESQSPFGLGSGTSFSAPAVAGVAALMLSAQPSLTPMEVREALRMTGDRAQNPNNQFGWGVVDAYEAVLFHGTAFSNQPQMSVNRDGSIEISTKTVSKVGIDPQKVQIIYSLSGRNLEQHRKMTIGSEKNQFIATIPDFARTGTLRFYFSGTDSAGVTAVYPHNAPDSVFNFTTTPVSVSPEPLPVPEAFVLAQNYPNPFNPRTTIRYYLPQNGKITVTIYNVLGQMVRILLKGESNPAGNHSIQWDGRDELGRLVPSGVYLYRMQANEFSAVKKMALVK
ncbi:S8 family serine peptidase [bacterium]|nr:S8 family serine peptidase [bacterium]